MKLILITFSVPLGLVLGQSCTSPICSPNPVPCAHCIGTWTDNGNNRWTVTSPGNPSAPGTQTVTGSVTAPAPAGCPDSTWSVSGTLTQSFGASQPTTFTWTASNPSPSGTCNGYTPASTITYTGSIDNDGCDTASGSWSNSNGLRGNFSMTKPSEVASSETSDAIAWWSTYPTILMFQGTISSSDSNSLAGRQVFESANGSPSDSCWRSSDATLGYEEYHLTGAGWFVGYFYFSSSYYYDYVGIVPDYITYYRQQNRPPCIASASQTMNIYTRAGLGSVPYKTNLLYGVNLPDYTNVGVARDGVQGWRTW